MYLHVLKLSVLLVCKGVLPVFYIINCMARPELVAQPIRFSASDSISVGDGLLLWTLVCDPVCWQHHEGA
jgi:hypothetical protein